jgi:uncharacterized membrane protein
VGLLEAIVVVAAIIVGARLFSANRDLQTRLRELELKLNERMDRIDLRQDRLERRGSVGPAGEAVATAPVAPAIGEMVPPPEPEVEDVIAPELSDSQDEPVEGDGEPEGEPSANNGAEPWTADTEPPATTAAPAAPRFDWERFIGLRLPVWLGAIALCIAGFFFVSYAIDSGFFTPEMRVLSAAAAALAFLVGAEVVRRRVKTGNVAAIASALGAAAIATAYATAYLASVTYNLVPTGFGFIATAIVTVIAIAIALAYGQVVALVGIIGGYLAPILYGSGSDPSAAFLGSYLILLTAASYAAIRYKSWWRLSAVGLVGPALWGFVWALTPKLLDDVYWSDAFLLSLPIIVAIASWPGWREDGEIIGLRGFTNALTPQRGALVATVILAGIGFILFTFGVTPTRTLGYWQGFIVYGLLAVALGFLSPPHRALQIPVMISAAVGLLLWDAPDRTTAFVVIGLLAVVFGFGSLDQFRRLREPGLWASMLAFTALWLFAMALFKVTGWQSALEHKFYWALGALALAAAFVGLLSYYGRRIENEAQRSQVYAAWGGTVTTLVSLAVVLILDPTYFPAASALAVLGLAAVHLRVPVHGLRVLATIYLAIYAVLVFLSWVASGSPIGLVIYFLAPAFEDHSLVLLVLPGIALIAAATLFQRARADGTDPLVPVLDVVGVVVLALGLEFLLVPQHERWVWSQSLVVAARITAAELALALVAIYLGSRYARASAYISGVVLSAIVSLAMLGVSVGPIYVFWPNFAVPGPAIFNIAQLTYTLPALLLFAMGWLLRQDSRRPVHYFGIVQSVFAVGVVYTMLLVAIRQAWNPGAATLVGQTSQSEFYAYSIATLLFGILLLVLGVAFRHRGARALSFVFVLAATVKVFLFDAAALTGLWRVLSFLLMGLSFLGISWAYARFVFGIGLPKPKDDAKQP